MVSPARNLKRKPWTDRPPTWYHRHDGKKKKKKKSRPFSSTPGHRNKKRKRKRIRETIGGFVLVVPANVGVWMDMG